MKTLSRSSLGVALAVVLSANLTPTLAGSIPYPHPGTYNAATYSFTAATTGDVTAYFAGTGAAFTEEVGLLDNGVLTAAGYGLVNHFSTIGTAFDFGKASAGDTLVFDLYVFDLNKHAFSDPSLNVPYDDPGATIHNHIYSTNYTKGSIPAFGNIPSGTYVGFEDLPSPSSDFEYTDEQFVFTNAMIGSTAVPEPGSVVLMSLGAAGVIAQTWRRRRQAPAA